MTNKEIISTLTNIAKSKPSSLRSEVATEALEYHNIQAFFADLAANGCISGMITKLIYYSDSHKFYDTYYSEIEQLRENYQTETGLILIPKGDLKNWYAWFAFEQTAYTMAKELGL